MILDNQQMTKEKLDSFAEQPKILIFGNND